MIRALSFAATIALLGSAPKRASTDPLQDRAQAAAHETPQAAPVEVHTRVTGTQADRIALAEVLDEFLAPKGLNLTVDTCTADEAQRGLDTATRSMPVDPHTLATIWIRLDPTTVSIYLVDGQRGRLVIRELPLDTGQLDEVAREQIAYIVESNIDAIISGAHVGVSRAEGRRALGLASQPAPAPLPSPEPRALRHRAHISVGWLAQGWSRGEPPVHGPTLELAWLASARSRPRGLGLGLALFGQWRPALAVGENPDFDLYLRGANLQLWTLALWPVDAPIALEAGLGGGVELVHHRAIPRSDRAVSFGSGLRVVPSLGVRIGPRFSIGMGARQTLLARIFARVEFSPTTLDYRLAGPAEQVFSAWPVRPGLGLELGWRGG